MLACLFLSRELDIERVRTSVGEQYLLIPKYGVEMCNSDKINTRSETVKMPNKGTVKPQWNKET